VCRCVSPTVPLAVERSGVWIPRSPHHRQHLDRFSRFCTAHCRNQQPDRPCYFVCSNRSRILMLWMRCGLNIQKRSILQNENIRRYSKQTTDLTRQSRTADFAPDVSLTKKCACVEIDFTVYAPLCKNMPSSEKNWKYITYYYDYYYYYHYTHV